MAAISPTTILHSRPGTRRARAQQPITAAAGLVLIAVFSLVAIFAPAIAPTATPGKVPRDGYSAEPRPMGAKWKSDPPAVVPGWYPAFTGKTQWVHLLGTTQGQYDLFYAVIWGARTAFETGLLVVALTFGIGVTIGSIAGYAGGIIESLLMRLTDVFMTLPAILAAMVLSAILTPILGQSIWPSAIALVAFGWMGYARVIRGDVISIKKREYILAAQVSGAKSSRILLRHILPNAIFPTLGLASLAIGNVVLSFATLSFLGIGLPAGYPDWGQMISFARSWISELDTYWYVVVWPGLALALFALGWNLVGDALRDALDPWTKRARTKT
jgi:ABC-type dipeptide/oligopeptide/nickel transport systems, permease components